jgi:hypothetical protein
LTNLKTAGSAGTGISNCSTKPDIGGSGLPTPDFRLPTPRPATPRLLTRDYSQRLGTLNIKPRSCMLGTSRTSTVCLMTIIP